MNNSHNFTQRISDSKINVEKQTISVPSKKMYEHFDINPYKKICIMNGYDDIDYMVNMQKEIKKFEKKRKHDYSLAFE